MVMKLREATPSDYEAIVRLVPTREELFLVYPGGKHPFTVEQLHSLAAVRQELTVACQGKEIVAFADLYNVEPGKWAFIGNVVVARDFRGQGLGRKLVTHMVRQAFDQYKVREARISVFNDNTPALLLYAGMHFEPYAVEERVDPIGKRVGLIHMRLENGKQSAEAVPLME